MAKKYVKVQVSKHIYTDVYLEYDENDPRFQGIVKVNEIKISGEETLAKLAAYSQSMKALEPHAIAACEYLKDYDWEIDNQDIEVDLVSPIKAEEALQFECYEVPKN